jgi:hypothetical protein
MVEKPEFSIIINPEKSDNLGFFGVFLCQNVGFTYTCNEFPFQFLFGNFLIPYLL